MKDILDRIAGEGPNEHLKTLDDAIRRVAEAADGIKAGCAAGDEWPDANDKQYYDAQVDCLTRLRSMRAALARTSEAAQKPTVEQVIDLLRQAVREIPASIATELWQVTPIQIMWVIGMLRKDQPISASEAAAGEPCGACNGSGWVTRDPDIGTDQECFVCDGRGRVNEAAPQPASAQAKGE